jgi:hypothetical protein
MGPSEKAIAALLLGGEIAKYGWKAWADDYVSNRPTVVKFLQTIGLDEALLPETAAGFQATSMTILEVVYKHLTEERARLNGDCYALPMFIMNYMSFRAIAHGALGSEIETETTLLRGALEDLGIDATDEGVMSVLRDEISLARSGNTTFPTSRTGETPRPSTVRSHSCWTACVARTRLRRCRAESARTRARAQRWRHT